MCKIPRKEEINITQSSALLAILLFTNFVVISFTLDNRLKLGFYKIFPRLITIIIFGCSLLIIHYLLKWHFVKKGNGKNTVEFYNLYFSKRKTIIFIIGISYILITFLSINILEFFI